jgi:hypothetical protein
VNRNVQVSQHATREVVQGSKVARALIAIGMVRAHAELWPIAYLYSFACFGVSSPEPFLGFCKQQNV